MFITPLFPFFPVPGVRWIAPGMILRSGDSRAAGLCTLVTVKCKFPHFFQLNYISDMSYIVYLYSHFVKYSLLVIFSGITESLSSRWHMQHSKIGISAIKMWLLKLFPLNGGVFRGDKHPHILTNLLTSRVFSCVQTLPSAKGYLGDSANTC